MKLLILTTQTTHHAKFVQDIAALWPETKAVIETKGVKAPFDTSHAYLAQQDAYEQDLFFNGQDVQIADLVETAIVENINDDATAEMIEEFQPDLIVVFGTRKILPKIINLLPERMLNLHGGDPEYYRGLDTHLWAIHNGEFDQLITTLHIVAPELDTGDVVAKEALQIASDMKLHELRAENTRCCVKLVSDAVKAFENDGAISAHVQAKKGDYYSFMPSETKEECLQKFEIYTKSLACA